jgi:hypothetical protein
MPIQLAIGQGSFTTWLRNMKLDLLFGASNYALAMMSPVSFYVGLSLLPASLTGQYSEPFGSLYRRAVIPNDRDHWTDAVEGRKFNKMPIVWTFPAYGWGRVLSVFLADAPTAGNVYIVANLVTPLVVDTYYLRDVAAGPSFAPGAMFIQDV